MAIAPAMPATFQASPERRYYRAMTVALLAVVLLGFSRSFYLRPLFPNWPSPHESIFYVHGLLLTAWFVLLVVQAWLIAANRTRVHRSTGVLGAVLAVSLVLLTAVAALVAAGRPTGFVGVPVPPLQFLIVPAVDLVFFGAFVGLALARRKTPQTHKRLMLLASITFLVAAFARWPGIHELGIVAYFGFADLFLVPMVVWDFVLMRRVHSATLWGGLALVISQPLKLILSNTAPWLAFAQWSTSLLR